MERSDIIEIKGLQIYRYIMPGIESNMYLVIEGEEALIIDPNVNEEAIKLLTYRGIEKVVILLTHEHYDHISGVNRFREAFPAEVICTEIAAGVLDNPNKNLAKFGDILLMDKTKEQVVAGEAVWDRDYICRADKTFNSSLEFLWKSYHVHMKSAPGHSRGGALIFIDDILFSGDNLVNGAGVICRLPGGSWKIYCEETKPVIEELPDSTWILPGHGESGELGELRKYMEKFGKIAE